MKQPLIILALLLISTFTYAQDYNIEWNEFQDIPSNSRFNNFLINDDNFSILYSKNETYYSHIYNSNLELAQQVEFEAPYNPKYADTRFLRFIRTKSQEKFALYSEKSKDKKNWTLYASPVKNGKVEKGKEIFSLQKQNAKHLNLSREVRYNVNSDRREVVYAFLNRVKESSKKGHYEIVVAVFDENMNLKWNKSHKIEDIDEHGRYLFRSKIDMNGKVHLLLKKILTTTLKKAKKKEGKISLYTVYSLSQTETKEHDIILENELEPFSINIQLPNTSNNKVIINGTYINNDGDKDIRINGTFFIEIDTKTEEVIYKLKSFKGEIKTGNLTRPLSSFSTENGNYVMTLEDVSLSTTGTGQGAKTTYIRGDVYLIYFNEDGKYLKTLQINRKGKGVSASTLITLDNKTHVMYSNTKSKKTELIIVDNKTMSIIHEQELNQPNKEKVLETKKFNLIFPLNDSIIIYNYNGNKYVVGKLNKKE